MPKAKTTFDVYISHTLRDAAISAELARVLRSYDLSVFTDAESAVGNIEDLLWDAMSESQALVAIIPEGRSSASIALELGAAKAWNKPIFAVAANPARIRLPVSLKETVVYTPSRIDELAQEIKKLSASLTDSEQKLLVEEYARVGVPVDQLLLQPKPLSLLTKQFKRRAKRNVTSEELLRTLLRIRKRGGLRPSR